MRHRDVEANRFYASKRWASIRRRKLTRNPTCECGPDCCPTGCGQPANEVDHIDGNWRNNRDDNHQSLTTSCHSRKTRRSGGRRHRTTEPHPGLVR